MDEDITKLTSLTAGIVAAYVGNNSISQSDLPSVIRAVFDALKLSSTGPVTPTPKPTQEPAISIRKSVQPDSITCLECGKKLKMLKRHLSTDHELSVEEYRAKWGLPPDYPAVAPNYASQRSQLAMKIGLGKRARK